MQWRMGTLCTPWEQSTNQRPAMLVTMGTNMSTTGDEMRTCGPGGTWNGTAPTCQSELWM